MPKFLNKNTFIPMPWKNGKGQTLELYRIPRDKVDSFNFRISMADVSSDGPFSNFPYIDRTLFLVTGHGLILNGPTQEVTLIETWKPFHFSGEEKITCHLINGPCQDFNIMIDRRYGKAESSTFLTRHHHFECLSDLTFIYNTQDEQLIVLQKGENHEFSSSTKNLLIVIHIWYVC